jgi:hypothetical protein
MHCLHAAYGCRVPDKRQTSKQRRAARNRAYREAMIARRENAQAEREQARQARAARATTTGSTGASGAAGRGGATTGRPQPAIVGRLYGRPPGVGDTAVAVALLAAVVFSGVALYMAFTSNSVPVDHAGDPIDAFPAVSRQAYAIANDTEPVTETVSLVDAYGPVIPIFAVLPSLVAAGAFVSHRREPRSRPLTIGLVALALVSVFNLFAIYFLPALIALAIAGFQVRKTELPARMAGGAGGAGGRRPAGRDADEDDDVIDVEEVDDEDLDDEELEDEYVDDELEDEDLEDEEIDDAEIRAGDDEDEPDAESEDVLADLEAEIEEEPDAEAETGRRGRGRGAGGRSSRR